MKRYLIDLAARLKADMKKAHKSVTLWFNAVMGAAAVGIPIASDAMPQLQDFLPANVYHYAMGAAIVGNIVLRFKTNTSLAGKP